MCSEHVYDAEYTQGLSKCGNRRQWRANKKKKQNHPQLTTNKDCIALQLFAKYNERKSKMEEGMGKKGDAELKEDRNGGQGELIESCQEMGRK